MMSCESQANLRGSSIDWDLEREAMDLRAPAGFANSGCNVLCIPECQVIKVPGPL